MKNNIRLSQCMIVKNEEKNIRQALTWGKEITCEQIVVDTGSTDRTVEIAKEMGAKVFHFTWINDFSAAKNFAIEQASGNWIAFLDADEYFSQEDAKKVIPLISRLEKENAGKTIVIRTPWINLDDNGEITSIGTQERLFRKIPELKYQNKVHEALQFTGGKNASIFDAKEILSIYHTGYAQTVFNEKRKLDRNLAILEQEVAENPENYDAWVYIGDSCFGNGQYERAEEAYNKVIDHIECISTRDHKDRVFCNLLQLKYIKPGTSENEIVQIYQKAVECGCQSPDAEYWIGRYMFDHRKDELGVSYFELALKKLEGYKSYGVINIASDLSKVYRKLFEVCRFLNKPSDAVRYGVLFLRIEPYGEEVLRALLSLLGNETGDEKTAEATFQFLEKLYDFSRVKDKMFLAIVSRKYRYSALEQIVLALMSPKEREFFELNH